ncbi:hypothetical protein Ancab_040152 [Ancistrocladus abbreviatus]
MKKKTAEKQEGGNPSRTGPGPDPILTWSRPDPDLGLPNCLLSQIKKRKKRKEKKGSFKRAARVSEEGDDYTYIDRQREELGEKICRANWGDERSSKLGFVTEGAIQQQVESFLFSIVSCNL